MSDSHGFDSDLKHELILIASRYHITPNINMTHELLYLCTIITRYSLYFPPKCINSTSHELDIQTVKSSKLTRT